MRARYQYFYRRPKDNSLYPNMSDWGTHSLTETVKNIRSLCSISNHQIDQIKSLKLRETVEFILPIRGTRDSSKVVVHRQF